ncbi:MAG TPA: undecaprenyldiphospho-muramoylpentapeptide beta-N-acetylglucosaminyltransferase [Bacteroidales bacterium]|nr:undecaprenyldiphospho-muramoylpentapeptide beta-N-acetylglucosaminyltransferase [Bacteroidales bacterium]
MQQLSNIKVILSGGGTGGHIFPAVAIANAIKAAIPDVEIMFVGAKGRMEMEKVPAAGYPIKGLWISGLQRRLTLDNLSFPIKMIYSFLKAGSIIRQFKPDVAIGTGGYASWPTLSAAASRGIPTFIQEQNSFPGITNKKLAKKAHLIFVAYEGMEKYFQESKIRLVGNPIRQDIAMNKITRNNACEFFGLDPAKKTVLIIGGSLGALTINQSIRESLQLFAENGLQVLWQTGKSYSGLAADAILADSDARQVTMPFIARMDMAYAAADLVVSRAGAIAISEICAVGKPCILVPSPNVAEDHQTKNAMALAGKNAALMVADKDAIHELGAKVIELADDENLQNMLRENILKMAYQDAASTIASEVIAIIGKTKNTK